MNKDYQKDILDSPLIVHYGGESSPKSLCLMLSSKEIYCYSDIRD